MYMYVNINHHIYMYTPIHTYVHINTYTQICREKIANLLFTEVLQEISSPHYS